MTAPLTPLITRGAARYTFRLRGLIPGLAVAVLVLIGVGGAATARADVDTDFAAQLHAYGIYGPRDYNAWLAKITCKRMTIGLDRTAIDAAKFLSGNLADGTTTQQVWQFLSAALGTYCPEQLPALAAIANAPENKE